MTTVVCTHFPGDVTNVTNGQRHEVAFADLADLVLGQLATDTRTKGACGYLSACGLSGRRNDSNAEPTRLAYLDWDDAPLDEGLLAGLADGVLDPAERRDLIAKLDADIRERVGLRAALAADEATHRAEMAAASPLRRVR